MQIAAHCNAVPCVTASKWPLLHLRHAVCLSCMATSGGRFCASEARVGVSTVLKRTSCERFRNLSNVDPRGKKKFPPFKTCIQLLLMALLVIDASVAVCRQHHSLFFVVDVT